MDPISIAVEVELGALLLAVVGGIATWMNHRHQKAKRRQRDRHHREMLLLRRRQHVEHLAEIRAAARVAEDAVQTIHDDAPAHPASR